MRWSIAELIDDLKKVYKNGFGFWRSIIRFPYNFIYSFKVFFYWLFTGRGYFNKWSLDIFLVNVLLDRIKNFYKLADDFVGYPSRTGVETIEDWKEIIRKIILGLESYIKLDKGEENPVAPMDLKILYKVWATEQKEIEMSGEVTTNTLLGEVTTITHDPNRLTQEELDIYNRSREEQKKFQTELENNYKEAMALLAEHLSDLWD